jgi:hypothetical protein
MRGSQCFGHLSVREIKTMKTTIHISAFLLTACCFTIGSAFAETTHEDETTRILFLAGARSHASGEHEFRAGCMLLAKALTEQSGLDVEATVISGWPEDESVFDNVDAVVIYSDGTSVIQNGWEQADLLAKSGVGLMFMHYAVHPSPEEGEQYFRPWIGAAMETGYSVNPHWVADLIALPDHPVSNGVKDMVQAYDEFYYAMRFQKDRGKVLDLVTATPTKDRLKRIINLWTDEGVKGIGKPQALMWGVEREDGGRGVGFVGGHYHRNWANDGFRQIVLNSIVWVAGAEVPEDGVESKPVTEDELNENLDVYEGLDNPRIPLPDIAEFLNLPPAKFITGAEHAAAAEKRKEERRKARQRQQEEEKEKQKNKAG